METIQEFAQKLADTLMTDPLIESQGITCEVSNKMKTNGVILTGIICKSPEELVSPIIYVDSIYQEYQEGRPFTSCLSGVIDITLRERLEKHDIHMEDFMNYDLAKEKLSTMLVNTKANREMLKQMPHQEVEDLSLIAIIKSAYGKKGNEAFATVKVNSQMLESWGISEEQVLQDAIYNAPLAERVEMKKMESVLQELLSPDDLDFMEIMDEDDKKTLYVLSNESRMYGAAVIANPDIQKMVAEQFPEGCYVLPSSVHEVLLLSKENGMPVKELKKIVEEINGQEVAPDEILSNNIYECDRDGKFRQLTGRAERSKEITR